MKITIKFYSNWAIGSGQGGESKDSIILKDKNGLPYIPGRTLKGLIRDAFMECGYSQADAIKLFGQIKNNTNNNLQSGTLRFNSAYLPEEYQKLEKSKKQHLFDTRSSTRIDDKKQAIDHSLRKNEVIIPLELETSIVQKDHNAELEDDDLKKIEKALKMLKIMGENRHRGLGRCKITVEKQKNVPEENEQNDIKINNNVATFRCTITEPLILLRKSKTEQNVKSLDYLPGSIFRGIVAGVLASNVNDKNFDDVIFNGTVQFGDAHLVINKKRSHKIPFFFYYDKSKNEKKFYNFHLLEVKDWIDKKLKLKKDGYLIAENGNISISNIQFDSSLKSSRNYKERSSEKGGMFYYQYIDKGQTFEFKVRSNNTNYLNEIINILDGKNKYFGKSKGAEFGGALEIKYLNSEEDKEPNTLKGNYLYAESNLCFLNEYGEFTTTPTPKQLGADKGEIDWENSQIKFRTYTPYNQYRKNWDTERLIIEKGSVIAFKNEVDFDTEKINKGLGCFLTEGYGRVLIDPEFLNGKEKPYEKDRPANDENDEMSSIGFIDIKHQKLKTEIEINDVVKEYKNIKFSGKATNSQWGRIFNATTRANNYEELKAILYGKENGEQQGRDQSIFYGGKNKWNESDIYKISEFLTKEAVVNNEIQALRKLAKIKQSEK